jgi:hypothetical protein
VLSTRFSFASTGCCGGSSFPLGHSPLGTGRGVEVECRCNCLHLACWDSGVINITITFAGAVTIVVVAVGGKAEGPALLAHSDITNDNACRWWSCCYITLMIVGTCNSIGGTMEASSLGGKFAFAFLVGSSELDIELSKV